MRHFLVVVLDVFTDQVVQAPGAHDDKPVQAIVLHGLDEPFHEGVEAGRSKWKLYRSDALASERIVKRASEL